MTQSSLRSMRRARFDKLMAIAWRESRTARRRLLLYMSSISLGVSALVAIDSFTENVSASVAEQSKALLGGDVSLRSRAAYSPKVTQLLDSLSRTGTELAHVTQFASMGLVPRTGNTRLVQVRAVSANYPLYGEIVTQPAGLWSRLASGRNAIVDPGVLVSLDAQVGDTIMLGTARFVILAAVLSVPGDAGVAAAIAPRVFIPRQYVSETGLLVFGSRAEYETLVRLPRDSSPEWFAAEFNPVFSAETPRVRVETVGENETDMRRSIDELGTFLGLVGLVALLLGGIGVASGVHAFVMRKIDTVAVLRCLGATSTQVLVIYVVQAAAMGLVGAIFGAALGVAVQFGLPLVLKDVLPVDVSVRLVPKAILLGLGIGLWVSLIFALRPLLALRGVSPLQTLRRESDTDVMRRARRDSAALVAGFAIVASVLAIALTRAGTIERATTYATAIAGSIAVLWLTAVLLSFVARRFARPTLPFVARQGIANLYRPGNQTRAVILALGFGMFLMSTLYQVQHNLLRQLDVRLDEAAANVVFFDVQEDQQPAVDSIIRAAGHTIVQQVPIVPMRVAAVKGKSTARILSEADSTWRARRAMTPEERERAPQPLAPWTVRREYRSTYRDTMVASDKLVSGEWFDANDKSPQMSMEKEVAEDMKVVVGDTVTWNVQGVHVSARLTSIREVTWARFEPNFFVVFNSPALQEAPRQYAILANAPTPLDIARLQRDVVRLHPSVSSLDLSLIQRTVNEVLGKITTAIRFMAIVCLAFGIPVLFSAVAATRRERLREGVLLKTLGATKRQVGRIMLVEYLLLGALGSLAGMVLSIGGAWMLMRNVFNQTFVPAITPVLLIAFAMTALAVAIGLLTGREVFRSTPMAALREA
jgi:putative ABC transport system permease protein